MGLTSDHSPVIQMYSQGGSPQLSTSAGRSLASQWALLCSRLFSSTQNTLRSRDASPHVFVHCVQNKRQLRQPLRDSRERIHIQSQPSPQQPLSAVTGITWGRIPDQDPAVPRAAACDKLLLTSAGTIPNPRERRNQGSRYWDGAGVGSSCDRIRRCRIGHAGPGGRARREERGQPPLFQSLINTGVWRMTNQAFPLQKSHCCTSACDWCGGSPFLSSPPWHGGTQNHRIITG